jgi:hypothetical protein
VLFTDGALSAELMANCAAWETEVVIA